MIGSKNPQSDPGTLQHHDASLFERMQQFTSLAAKEATPLPLKVILRPRCATKMAFSTNPSFLAIEEKVIEDTPKEPKNHESI